MDVKWTTVRTIWGAQRQIGTHKGKLDPTRTGQNPHLSLAASNFDDGHDLQKLVLFVTELNMLLFQTQRRRRSGGV